MKIKNATLTFSSAKNIKLKTYHHKHKTDKTDKTELKTMMSAQVKNTVILLGALLALYVAYWLGLQQGSNSRHTSDGSRIAEQSHSKISSSTPKASAKTVHTTPNTTPNTVIQKTDSDTPLTQKKAVAPSSTDNSAPAIAVIFEQLLQTEKYAEAINVYHATWSVSQSQADKLRQQFINHIQQVMAGSTIAPQLENAFSSYLADFYDDIDILLLKAINQGKQGFYYEALDTFLLAKTYAYTTPQQQQVNGIYHQFFTSIDKHFIAQQNQTELISLYLHAEVAGLLTEENQFRLITLYLQNNNSSRAEHYAELLGINPLWQEKIAAIMPQQQAAESKKDKGERSDDNSFDDNVALTQIAHQFIINTGLSSVDTPLLIDTGASMTTITEDFYRTIRRKANLQFQSTQVFNTANGKTTGSIYRADTFTIGKYVLNNIEIAVLDYPSSQHSKGLLGMNVLRHFRFEIDQQNNLLKLNTIKE